MKKLITLLTFLLIAASSFSQSDYPKSILIDSDTLVLFTPNQVAKMNVVFLYLDEQKELNESLENKILLLNNKLLILEATYNVCEQKSILLVRVADERLNQVEILTSENKKQDKKINILKKMRNLYGIGGVVVGGVTAYFLSQILIK